MVGYATLTHPANGAHRMSLHDKFKWPEPDHEADEVIFRNVRKHGCHIVGIADGEPPFEFSIGLYLNYGHPELIIFGLPSSNASGIINDVRNRAAAGEKFFDGSISDDLLDEATRFASGKCRMMRTATTSARRAGSTHHPGLLSLVSRSSGRIATGGFPGKRDASHMSRSGSRC
jgi:Domain of unknown function (DUF4262)